jgi:hypothetical protein
MPGKEGGKGSGTPFLLASFREKNFRKGVPARSVTNIPLSVLIIVSPFISIPFE